MGDMSKDIHFMWNYRRARRTALDGCRLFRERNSIDSLRRMQQLMFRLRDALYHPEYTWVFRRAKRSIIRLTRSLRK